MIDIDEQLLPDVINYILLWLGLFASLYFVFISPHMAIFGAMVGYLSLWGFTRVFKLITGKDGMGYGDFKLFAVFGAWMGWQVLPFIIIFASFIGAVVGLIMLRSKGESYDTPIAFGPYLAVAGWLGLLFGADIVHAYINLSGLM